MFIIDGSATVEVPWGVKGALEDGVRQLAAAQAGRSLLRPSTGRGVRQQAAASLSGSKLPTPLFAERPNELPCACVLLSAWQTNRLFAITWRDFSTGTALICASMMR
ncbi:MAG TPA: hypothetical protein VFM36_16145 [Thermoanaerobaculia bacterium]|nr:hypothetical protein [Thermoanaerobaculia bacterium]